MSDMTIKWTWLKERVNGPLAFEADYGNVSAIVSIPVDDGDWHIQVWQRTYPGYYYLSYETPLPGQDRTKQQGWDTAAEAKREAEKHIHRLAGVTS